MVPQAVLHNICSMNEQTLPCGLAHCKNQFCRQLKKRQRTVSDKLVNNLDQRIYSYIRYRSKGTPPPPVSNCRDVLNPCRQFWELMYCGFRAVIQRDSFYSIQQTEQLYRQLVVPNTADQGSMVFKTSPQLLTKGRCLYIYTYSIYKYIFLTLSTV